MMPDALEQQTVAETIKDSTLPDGLMVYELLCLLNGQWGRFDSAIPGVACSVDGSFLDHAFPTRYVFTLCRRVTPHSIETTSRPPNRQSRKQ
jgi:hypothetical protein